jgi:hypothetical protein
MQLPAQLHALRPSSSDWRHGPELLDRAGYFLIGRIIHHLFKESSVARLLVLRNCCSLLSFMLVSISGKYFFFPRVPLEGLPSRIWQIKGLDVGNPGMSGIYQFNPGMSGIYFF